MLAAACFSPGVSVHQAGVVRGHVWLRLPAQAPTLVDPSPVTPSSAPALAAGGRQQLPHSSRTAGSRLQLVPLCVIPDMMQLLKAMLVMWVNICPLSSHPCVGLPPSHPYAGALPTIAGYLLLRSCSPSHCRLLLLFGVSYGVWCSGGVLRCSAPCLPASQAVDKFIVGLSKVFVWAAGPGSFLFSIPSMVLVHLAGL